MAAAPTGLGAGRRTPPPRAARTRVDRAGTVEPAVRRSASPARRLATTSRWPPGLINADLGTRCVAVSRQGWDTHATPGRRPRRPSWPSSTTPSTAFFAAWPRRSAAGSPCWWCRSSAAGPPSNASLGTDHGTAGMAMVIGDNVKGGLYGASPSLTTLDAPGNLVPTVDVRSVYASVLGAVAGRATPAARSAPTYEQLRPVPGRARAHPRPLTPAPRPAAHAEDGADDRCGGRRCELAIAEVSGPLPFSDGGRRWRCTTLTSASTPPAAGRSPGRLHHQPRGGSAVRRGGGPGARRAGGTRPVVPTVFTVVEAGAGPGHAGPRRAGRRARVRAARCATCWSSGPPPSASCTPT